MCQGSIVDGKDEALLCEGKCGYWLHRDCASVSPTFYKELSTSDDPFVCLSCVNVELRQEVKMLRNEIDNMSAIRQQLSVLEAVVVALRKDVNSTRNSKQQPSNVRLHPKNANVKCSYEKLMVLFVDNFDHKKLILPTFRLDALILLKAR